MGDYYGDVSHHYDDDQWAEEEWLEELYSEHIAEFTLERLQSFYTDNPSVAQAPLRALGEAREMFAQGYHSAALVFAYIATEVGIKTALFKPIVYGLVHSDSTAEMVASLAVGRSIDRFRGLLFQILVDYGGIDLRAFTRPGSSRVLWQEIRNLIDLRNRVIHRAETVTEAQAEDAIAIASCVLDDIFPNVIQRLDLQLHNDNIVV